jgi:hypothetical protein
MVSRWARSINHLRAWWEEEEDVRSADETTSATKKKKNNRVVNLSMIESVVMTWLSNFDPRDNVRLISGGPGSGKSTFAKFLAASLAASPGWRVVVVPLQRLRGSGSLETRIDDYFRLQRDEPFDAETVPLINLGRDGHRDWLIIFDGLDELAKEGTGSETAAQDFATSLSDLRVRIGSTAAVRFLVLGRAPSMQDARRRLSLTGPGTLHIADMRPLKFHDRNGHEKAIVRDRDGLLPIDQRAAFWTRWALAKKLPRETPEALTAEALSDLTKEPLLAYLLILSGYVGAGWQQAAENRNRIYEAIFGKIWDRERAKETRGNLNDLGKEGFDSLLQALGLAAWRGGGRTGDENTFINMRDVFMRPDLLRRAKECGVADLNNLAILFYTRRDEEGGRGYEFLHKSFGEYLTARGLFSAFER